MISAKMQPPAQKCLPQPAPYHLFVTALLFAPLLYSFVASFLSERRGPTETSDWVIYVRGISIVVAIAGPALAHFIARQFQRLSRDQSPQQQFKLNFIAFLASSALFLTPATTSVTASIAGAPATDVYFFSLYSFFGILLWSWHKRALFRIDSQFPGEKFKPPQGISYVRAYTIVLILMSILAFLFLALQIFIVAKGINPEDRSFSLDAFWIVYYTVIVTGCWLVVILRTQKSQYALAATGFITFTLFSWIPLGTAAFIYWIGWVRKKEPRYLS